MKRECPSLFAALLVSLLVNVLLRSQTAYWPRAGLFSAVVCAPLLAGVGWLFGSKGSYLRKRELVVLIKPTIIRNESSWKEDLFETQNRMQQLDPRLVQPARP